LTLAGEPYLTAHKKEFYDFDKDQYPSGPAELHKDRLHELWHCFGGIGANPITRDHQATLGSDDDAMLVTRALYDHFLRPVAGETQCFHKASLPDVADLEGEQVDDSFIDRKWLVVVDYHAQA